jgi:hypothetical protein
MTTLTRWLLRAFADEWPGGLPQSGDADGPLVLMDRDESRVLEVDTTTDPTTLTRVRHTQKWKLNEGNKLAVATTDWPQDPAGLGGREYQHEPVLSVRIEAADAREGGHIADGGVFQDLALEAIGVVKDIDNGTLQAAPVADFYVSDPGTVTPQSENYKDEYSWQFEVQARGYEQR